MMTSLPGRSSAGVLSGVWFVKESEPLIHAAVGRDDEAGAAVSFDHELVQVLALLSGQSLE